MDRIGKYKPNKYGTSKYEHLAILKKVASITI